MLISKIGEFGLIERLRRHIKTDSSVIKGSGDDCAVLAYDKHHYQLFTCDMIVEGVDFTLSDPAHLIGRKALAVSISDIASCGGVPKHAVVSMGLPKYAAVEYVDKIAKGLISLSREYKINIVGGDISRAKQLVIDVSMLGVVEKENLVLRNGAKAGDLILVSGEIGAGEYGNHLKFIPRIKESRYLVENFEINSMIDISDGLLQDLNRILEQSNAGAIVYEALVPVSSKAKSFEHAVNAGEDFELLFTLSRREAKKLLKKSPHFPPFLKGGLRGDFQTKVTVIGEIRDKRYGFKLADRNNKEKIIIPEGFRHF